MNLSTRKSKLIILISLFVVFAISGGYLLWRINQPETVAPEDIEAAPLEVKEVDGYKIYIFGQNGTFTLDREAEVEYLVIGGGGGGGAQRGGGGGAGGFLEGKVTKPAGSYPVVVGGGGRGGTRNPWQAASSRGNNGGNSSVFGVVAKGGGGGGSGHNSAEIGPGKSGGSGGGSGGYRRGRVGDSFAAGSGTAGQGNSGGKGSTAYDPNNPSSGTVGHGGGGGGAGSAGAKARGFGGVIEGNIYEFYVGGFGGYGKASTITGNTVWYAGGGGGASYLNAWAHGGDGGGNPNTRPSGKNNSAGGGGGVGKSKNGQNRTGGGGGGGSTNADGGKGGSGIVVLRYKEEVAPKTYVVTYDPGEGGSCMPTSRTVNEGETSEAPSCSREGYNLVSFTRTSGSGGTLDSETGEVKEVTGDQTITATWEEISNPGCGDRSGTYPYTATEWPEENTEWCEEGEASEFDPNQEFPLPGERVEWLCTSGVDTAECYAQTEEEPEEEVEEEIEVTTVPETGIFDDSQSTVLVGLGLLFLGFAWEILGRGVFTSVTLLSRLPKKVSIHLKDMREERILKRSRKRKQKFENKVVKD